MQGTPEPPRARSPAHQLVHRLDNALAPRLAASSAVNLERAAMALLSPVRYVLASVVVAAAVVWHAFSTRQQ